MKKSKNPRQDVGPHGRPPPQGAWPVTVMEEELFHKVWLRNQGNCSPSAPPEHLWEVTMVLTALVSGILL